MLLKGISKPPASEGYAFAFPLRNGPSAPQANRDKKPHILPEKILPAKDLCPALPSKARKIHREPIFAPFGLLRRGEETALSVNKFFCFPRSIP